MPAVEAFFLAVFWSWVVSAAYLLVRAVPPRRASYPFANSESVAFSSIDDVPLYGAIIRTKRDSPWIILCHAFGGGHSDMEKLAQHLAQNGFNALTFDFRAHGRSGGFMSSFGYRELNDVYGALCYLSQQTDSPPKAIGIYGVSMGASVAIMAAARDERLQAVVADSPYTTVRELLLSYLRLLTRLPALPVLGFLTSTYRLRFGIAPDRVSPVDSAAAIAPRPFLLIAGKADRKTPLKGAQRIFAAAGNPKDLWVVKSDHRSAMSDNSEAYLERVLNFFKNSLN